MQTSRPRSGFTLLDLFVVILILAAVAGVLMPRVSGRLAAARDTRRLEEIEELRSAIERYHLEHGSYPAANANAAFDGWDVSQDGDLIPALVTLGYLEELPEDPINDDTYHYRYAVFPAGAHGCVGAGPFYVLAISAFETSRCAAQHRGYFKCSGRDWNREFAYVTGGGASFE